MSDHRSADETVRATPVRTRQPSGLVLVGVDGSPRNRAAIAWTVREARETGLGLLAVTVLPSSDRTPPPQPAWVAHRALLRASLVEERLRNRHRPPDKAFLLASGTPGPALARSARPGDLVVVGKRGAGTLQRLRIGSTSLSAATFVRVPLIMVPESWDQGAHAGAHLVVGVDGSGRHGKDGPALDLAFSRAARLGVPVLVFLGLELPPLHRWSVAELTSQAREREARLTALLGEWTRRFPRVQVGVRAATTAPTVGLLDAARGAQLLIVGRGTRRGALERLSLGSTARRVLQEATCPVAVAPLVPSAFSPEDALNHHDQESVA
jgi:nucleotide-binding universal stress UspA family protein